MTVRRTVSNLIRSVSKTRAAFRVFSVCRSIGLVPPNTVRRKLKFVGTFAVSGLPDFSLNLHNSGHYLEGEFFWQGYDGFAWERQERDLWLALSAHSRTIVDVGANTGVYSLLAKASNPSATVIAFEPQPNIFEALKRSCDSNSFDIGIQQLALSDSPGRLPFYNYGPEAFSGNTTAGSLSQEWRTEGQQAINVDVSTLDAFVKHHEIVDIDLIKIDVESLEPAVLRGASEAIKAYQPAILLEITSAELGREALSCMPNTYRCLAVDESGILTADQSPGSSSDQTNFLLCTPAHESLLSRPIRT